MDPDYLVRVIGNSLLTHLTTNTTDDLSYTSDLLLSLLQTCASPALNTVSKKNVFPNTHLHRQKCRLLQSCTILWNHFFSCEEGGVQAQVSAGYMQTVHDLLWKNISQESMPSSRCFMEWMLARGHVHGFFDVDLLLRRIKNYHGSAAMSISALTIAYLVARESGEFRRVFLDLALPYFIHNNHAVRMFIIYIWDRLSCDGGPELPPGYQLMSQYIRASEHCQKFMEKLKGEHMLSDFRVDEDVNLQFLFAELPRRLGMAVDESIGYPSFVGVDPANGHVPFTGRQYQSSSISCTSSTPDTPDTTTTTTDDTPDSTEHQPNSQRFQQKMVPIELAEAEQDLRGLKRAEALQEKTRAGRLIVLASFIDKLPNLAGLARTCEVLGAYRLCVPHPLPYLLASPDFQAVCMTADRWLDLAQVRPEQVVGYLQGMRASGFRIVAVEQSSESVCLSKYRFQKDTVLVLGNERAGVPAEVLHLVDDCVEIPQFGMVRSLNVHVTGSIVLWEGRKQLSGL
jgi:tRNA G18 (ribose-2'-O)-methylase SpoU